MTDNTQHVSGQLLDSSRQFAQSALRALPQGDFALFALHAGTALEHLSKAVLAQRHLALIAAADFDSLLHACEEESAAQTPAMRTISVTESIKRATRFVPGLAAHRVPLAVLSEARNGVVHLAQRVEVDELRIPFFKGMELLREPLGVSRDDYWGEFSPAVASALEESVQEAKVRAETAVAAARIAFQQGYGRFDEDERLALLHAVESGYNLDKYEEQIVDCPACSSPAVATGWTDTRWEADDEHSASFIGTFFPGYLHCRICGLELDGEDELQAARVNSSWEIEAEPADFYEPDWDEYR